MSRIIGQSVTSAEVMASRLVYYQLLYLTIEEYFQLFDIPFNPCDYVSFAH